MSLVKTDFLCAIVDILQRGLGSGETFESIFDLLEKTVPFDSATLYLYREEEDQLEVIHQKGDEIVDLAGELTFDRGKGLSSWVSKQRKPVILESLTKSRPGKEHRFNSFISMPLWTGDKLIGVLNLGSLGPEVYQRDEGEDYEIVSSQISLVMEKFLLQKQLQKQNKLLKRTLRDLKETQEKLIENERLAAIGEIVVTVNHEINNPLTSIFGLAEILEYTFNTGNQEKVREGLRAILNETRRIQRITQKLTEISSSASEEYVGTLRRTKLPV